MWKYDCFALLIPRKTHITPTTRRLPTDRLTRSKRVGTKKYHDRATKMRRLAAYWRRRREGRLNRRSL